MSGPILFTGGRPLRLGKQIGKGGEGTVYLIEGRPGEALKHYTLTDLADRSAKVEAMVRAGLAKQSALVSYPSAIATDSKGQFAGFIMRLVSGYQPIHNLYAPMSRKTNFPDADFSFLVLSALNVACAVADVHSRNCVIGDINHSGILVSDKAIVALIDADSFQIVDSGREHLCSVGVPEFTPPELQGLRLSGIRRTPNHDAFGLAVMIFQLLAMGKHPFSGTYAGTSDLSLDQAIKEHRFAYSLKRSGGTRPPPGAISLKDLTPQVAEAFEAAFDPSALRPSAAQWIDVLRDLHRRLRPCSKNPLHRYPETAPGCPWCRIEAERPVMLFLPKVTQPGPSPSPQGGAFDLQVAWAAIRAAPLPPVTAPSPILPGFDMDVSAEAIAAASGIGRRRLGGGAILAGAIAGAILVPSGFVIWLMVGGLGLFLGLGPTSPGTTYQKNLAAAESRWQQALADWEKRCGGPEVHANRATLEAGCKEYQALPNDRRGAHAHYDANRRNIQQRTWLESHSVRGAKIPGIGRGRQETLVSWGIETAWDVNLDDVLKVDGFGTVRASAMVVWRHAIAARFAYDPRPNAQDRQARAAIDARFDQRAEQLRTTLARGAQALHTATRTVLARWQTVDQLIVRAHHDHRRAQVDAAHVNAPILEQVKRIGTLSWCALILALVGLVALLAHAPDLAPKSEAQRGTQIRDQALESFAKPRQFRISPARGTSQANVRQSASKDGAIVDHADRGALLTATGRVNASDGSSWIIVQRKDGSVGYIAEALLRPWSEPQRAGPTNECASKPWLEKLLCSDPTVRNLDDQLNETYRRVRHAAPLAQRSYLLTTQRDWLARRGSCEHEPDPQACLAALYRARIDDLEKPVAGATSQTDTPPPAADQTPPPAVAAPPVGPVLRGPPSSLISADDYPPGAIRNNEEGRVTVQLHVTPRGTVDSCEVMTSSGYGDLDQTTCRILIRRARYIPVLDPKGAPIGSITTQTVTWNIPRY